MIGTSTGPSKVRRCVFLLFDRHGVHVISCRLVRVHLSDEREVCVVQPVIVWCMHGRRDLDSSHRLAACALLADDELHRSNRRVEHGMPRIDCRAEARGFFAAAGAG